MLFQCILHSMKAVRIIMQYIGLWTIYYPSINQVGPISSSDRYDGEKLNSGHIHSICKTVNLPIIGQNWSILSINIHKESITNLNILVGGAIIQYRHEIWFYTKKFPWAVLAYSQFSHVCLNKRCCLQNILNIQFYSCLQFPVIIRQWYICMHEYILSMVHEN